MNKKLNIKIVVANSFITRLKGLMFKTNINYALLIPKCNCIHTFFMKENINIIAINEHNKIIYLKKDIPKNKIIKIKYPQNKTSIIELPLNTSINYSLNDKLF